MNEFQKSNVWLFGQIGNGLELITFQIPLVLVITVEKKLSSNEANKVLSFIVASSLF